MSHGTHENPKKAESAGSRGPRINIVAFAHRFAGSALPQGGLAIDATAGNGHDTVFLARNVGDKGKVFAFDLQARAIEISRRFAEKEGCLQPIVFFQRGHETMADCLEPYSGKVHAIMFNLGYLPGGDKTRVTQPETTVAALDAALRLLAPGGRITVVVYPAHPGGEREAKTVRDWTSKLPFDRAEVFGCHVLTRNRSSPFLVVVEKR